MNRHTHHTNTHTPTQRVYTKSETTDSFENWLLCDLSIKMEFECGERLFTCVMVMYMYTFFWSVSALWCAAWWAVGYGIEWQGIRCTLTSAESCDLLLEVINVHGRFVWVSIMSIQGYELQSTYAQNITFVDFMVAFCVRNVFWWMCVCDIGAGVGEHLWMDASDVISGWMTQ